MKKRLRDWEKQFPGRVENIFRASFVLNKAGEEWKIKHEHVSVVHPDPYGVGDWSKLTTPSSTAS